MREKEKAKELVERYMPFVYCYMGSGMLSNDYNENVAKDNAKKCALIAVDEILNNFRTLTEGMQHYAAYSTIKFYEEVKHEINNL